MIEEQIAATTPAELKRLLSFWTADRLVSIRTPKTGTVTTVRVLSTEIDRFVLRIYRHKDTARLEREIRVLQWLKQMDLPVVTPLATLDGTTYLEDGGRLITLLPFARGTQVSREALEPHHLETLGTFLADLHLVLSQCPVPGIPSVHISLDLSTALANIARLEGLIESIEQPTEVDRYGMQRLETRRRWLEANRTTDVSQLFSLEFQPLHGDYQESNIFFEDGAVSGIIDWDKVYTAPAAWAVVRTVDLMLRFQAEPTRTFLRAYRQRKQLSLEELDIAAHCYGVMRAHDLWLFEEIYEVGNERCRQWMRSGDFTPIEQQWQQLRPHLT